MLDPQKSNHQTNLLINTKSNKFNHYIEIEFTDGSTVALNSCNLDYLFSDKDYINVSYIEKEEVLVREYFNKNLIKNIRTEYLIIRSE